MSIVSFLSGIKTFESFKNPVYRIYYGVMAGQWAAQSMLMMSNSLLVYRLTGSAPIIGVLTLSIALPSLIISLFGGAIADRVQKRNILLIGQVCSVLLSLSFAFAVYTGFLTAERWWLMIIVSFAEGSIMGYMMPASMSIIPEIVSVEGVMNGISLSSMGQTVFRLLSPAIAGFFIEAYGFAPIYFLMSGLYFSGVVFALFLPATGTAVSSGKNTFEDVVLGLRYLRRDTIMLLIVIFGLFHVVSGQPFMQLMPVFSEDILKVGASGLGIMMTFSGAGALAGSLVLASLPNRKRGIMIFLSGLIMGLAIIIFSFSRCWCLTLVIIPFAGLGPTMHMTLTSTIIQYYAEPNYRGRMQSFVMMGMGLASFGTFVAGLLSELMGIQWAVGGMAIFLAVVSVLFLVFARSVTKLE